MRPWVWFCLLAGAAGSQAILWLSSLPLGIPGEWDWHRLPSEPDVWWNRLGAAVAAGLYATFVEAVSRRLELIENRPTRKWELTVWLAVLFLASFIWIVVVQETSPTGNRMGKAAFVLYYPSSSGYFTKARYETPDPKQLLSGYENLMREGDVLHVGTHPPGLFLVFHALIAICERSPELSAVLDQTQPTSFVKTCDIITQNIARTRAPRLMLPSDRRVLWLASILVMAMASLTGLVLFGLVRRTHGIVTAWWTAALWPALPAVAIFQPKSDVAYALVGVLLVWIWLAAVDRRSMLLAFLAGIVAWCGLMMSLAILPVFLFTAIMTILQVRPNPHVPKIEPPATPSSEATDPVLLEKEPQNSLRFSIPPIACLVCAAFGLVLPTILLHTHYHINMLTVWWLNYQNHAGFYREYSRTYWKWLLVNPVELSFAAGWPIFLLAALSMRSGLKSINVRIAPLAWSIAIVWGTLWLTGKNSGEAARLWLIFFPWLIWLAGPTLAETPAPIKQSWLRPALVVLVIQLVVCALTVSRVNGFGFDT